MKLGEICAVAFAAALCLLSSRQAVAQSWSGLYVGAHGGYGWAGDDINLKGMDATSLLLFDSGVLPRRLAPDPQGLLAGGQIGFNFQAGAVVFGIEADYAFADIQESRWKQNVLGPFTFTTHAGLELENFATLRARLGFTPFAGTLLYVTSGVAFGEATLSSGIVTVMDTNPPCSIASSCASAVTRDRLTGWAVGGGWEQALGTNWSAKLDVLVYDLGEIAHVFSDPVNPISFGASAEVSGHVVRLGVNYRF